MANGDAKKNCINFYRVIYFISRNDKILWRIFQAFYCQSVYKYFSCIYKNRYANNFCIAKIICVSWGETMKISDLKLLETMLNQAFYGLIVATEIGNLVYVNHDISDDLGMNATEFLRQFPPLKTECPFFLKDYMIEKTKFQNGDETYYVYYIFSNDRQKALLAENMGLRKMLDEIDNGVIFSDPDGIIRVYNRSHSQLDGLEQQEVLGKHLNDVYSSEQHTKVLHSRKAIHSKYHHYITGDNRDIFCVTGTYPLIHEVTGEILGVYSVERDLSVIQMLLQKVTRLEEEATKNSVQNNTAYRFQNILGESALLKEAINNSKLFAASQSPILIYGETGTGKELFAQSIHNESPNFKEPFVAINCGAVPENLIESMLFGSVKGAYTGAVNQQGLLLSAKHGTLFLDEINSMPLAMQTKLLRALQERKVRPVGSDKELPIHCRIISSCNVEPDTCLAEGVFRKDLYYRLAMMRVNIPPLRQRGDDPVLLANHFVKKYVNLYRKKFNGFSEEFLDFLRSYDWPGNVRELEFIVEGCVAMMQRDETMLDVHHLPDNIKNNRSSRISVKKQTEDRCSSLAEALSQCERETVLQALAYRHWNITQAAKDLKIHRQNLQYRIRKLGIQKNLESQGE